MFGAPAGLLLSPHSLIPPGRLPEVLLRQHLRYFLSQELLAAQAWSKATGTGGPVLGMDLLANAAPTTRMVYFQAGLAVERADFYHDGL